MSNFSKLLIKSANPLLRVLSDNVEIESDNSKRIIRNLIGFMEENTTAQGVSAVQMGETVKIAVCRYKKKMYVVCNPNIVWRFGNMKSLEGCLSVKGRYYVKRPLLCKIEWYDEDNQFHSKVMGYKMGRIFMHEIDHMKGICLDKNGTYWKYTELGEELMRKEKAKKQKKVKA